MGFLADGADNPISNPSALSRNHSLVVVSKHRGALRGVPRPDVKTRALLLFVMEQRALSRPAPSRRSSAFYINTHSTFDVECVESLRYAAGG